MDIHCNTVTYNIPFAFKDPKDIRDNVFAMLRDRVRPSKIFKEKFGDSTIKIIIVLDNKNKELKILGPTIGGNLVDFTIWLPYKKIKNSSNYRLEYFNQIKEGLLQIFEKYYFDLEELHGLFEDAQMKVDN